jgi:hypothetical protein
MLQMERPSYQGSLRALGRYLDSNIYRHIVVVETDDGGFIVRAFADGGNLKADGIELPLSDLVSLINSHEQTRGLVLQAVKTPPLCPTGYEDFFRALGYELDATRVSGVRLIELSTGILVGFSGTNAKGEIQRSEILYDKSLITQALERGYQRRKTGAPDP